MSIAIIDPSAGISGDMTLGALLSLGLPAEWLEQLPARLGLEAIGVSVRDVKRAGVGCKQVEFTIPDRPHGRHVAELVRLVEQGAVSDWVKQRAVDAFRLIGDAEGRVHGVPPSVCISTKSERWTRCSTSWVDRRIRATEDRNGVSSTRRDREWLGGSGARPAAGPAPATGLLLEGLEIAAGGPVEARRRRRLAQPCYGVVFRITA
jgi:hypothetical protein